MLIIDQLRQHDRRLRTLAIVVLACMGILVAGLWHVQVVSARKYRENLRNQSFRSVRVPAIRGKILDRHGRVLVENAARFGINLYLEELPPLFEHEYTNTVRRAYLASHPETRITRPVRALLQQEARYRVVSNLVAQIGATLEHPARVTPEGLRRHYERRLFVPFPVANSLSPQQMALFCEQLLDLPGVELDIQPVRYYPYGSLGAHVLGYVQSVDRPPGEDDLVYKYYLPDYLGVAGVEGALDARLRGKPGTKYLLVNNLGYRQREEMRADSDPGDNVWLTLDLTIQAAAERALSNSIANARGAVVVLDAQNGDILALASTPAYDPNEFVRGLTEDAMDRLLDPAQRPLFNRATHGAYPPGSILKIITGLACLENGLDPSAILHSPGYYRDAKVTGQRTIGDTAPAGDYDFRRAFVLSCNSYFIHHGIRAGLKNLLDTGHRFGLGEIAGLPTRQEVAGFFPIYSEIRDRWRLGNVAHLCIGQEITTSPIQIALMVAAIANGGRLFRPRLITRIAPQTEDAETPEEVFPPGRIRRSVTLAPRHLEVLHRAMLADVEDAEGTGKGARVAGFRVAGKTGTAEIKGGGVRDQITWFASFGPYENPRYAVVVMIESGISGGTTCAPVARRIYEAIRDLEAGASRARSALTQAD
jgi:penicillin-binding protein 2